MDAHNWTATSSGSPLQIKTVQLFSDKNPGTSGPTQFKPMLFKGQFMLYAP